MAQFVYDQYVQDLIKQQKAAANAAFKRCMEALESNGYKKLETKEEKIAFLCREDGQVILEEASKEKVNFAQLASTLGFSQKELHQLAREHDEIYDAIDRGQAKQFDNVETALYKMATGYYIDEKKLFTMKDDRERERTTIEEHKRYITPSVQAQQYILNNKRQMEFYDRQLQAEQEKNTVHLLIEFVGPDDIRQKAEDDD